MTSSGKFGIFRIALAAITVAALAVAVCLGGGNSAVSAQDILKPVERTINMREAVRNYAQSKGLPLLADDGVLGQLGTINISGGPAEGESIDHLVPALLYSRRLVALDIGGVIHLLPLAQAINNAPQVDDDGLEAAGEYDWVNYTLILRGVDVNVVRTAFAPFLTREASVMPIGMARSPGMSASIGAMVVCDRAGNVRRLKTMAARLEAAVMVAPDVVSIDLPEGLKSEDVIRLFARSGGVVGEIVDDGKRFIGTTEPGMADVKHETLTRLAAAMAR